MVVCFHLLCIFFSNIDRKCGAKCCTISLHFLSVYWNKTFSNKVVLKKMFLSININVKYCKKNCGDRSKFLFAVTKQSKYWKVSIICERIIEYMFLFNNKKNNAGGVGGWLSFDKNKVSLIPGILPFSAQFFVGKKLFVTQKIIEVSHPYLSLVKWCCLPQMCRGHLL